MRDPVPLKSRRERSHTHLKGNTRESGATPVRSLRGLHILIVEDEYLIAAEIRAAVEDCGAKAVGPAATLPFALTLAAGDVSCGILDVSLGRDSVGPVAEALARRNIPFIFYSAQPPTASFLKDWRHITLLEKPAANWAIVAALQALMTQPRVG